MHSPNGKYRSGIIAQAVSECASVMCAAKTKETAKIYSPTTWDILGRDDIKLRFYHQ